MAADGRTPEVVRNEISRERDELAGAVEQLREGLGAATDIREKLRSRLPVVAAGAVAGGFVLAGGIGATMRLFAPRPQGQRAGETRPLHRRRARLRARGNPLVSP